MGTNASNSVFVHTVDQLAPGSSSWAPPSGALHQPDARVDARRWIRRKRILYTVVGIYLVLSLMWFAIDMADGTENLWFYWPMLGTGTVVAITAVVLLGVGGVFGADWEKRQLHKYLERHG